MQSMSENDFECLARTGVNTPAMAKMTGKQEVIPNNPSGNRLLAPVVKKGFPAGAPSG
jgi:hypothetical protein